MNTMIVPNQTMTSKQIAEIVQSRHDSVKRTIERLATDQLNTDGGIKSQAVIVRPPMVDEQSVDSMGRSRTESVYHINERDSYIVVAQLCPEYTAKLVDYWMATKNQTPAIPQTFAQALRLAADLQDQLAIAGPKAAALDRIADTQSLFTIRESAKTLKIKERDLVALLLSRGWAFRDSRSVMQPYAEKIAAGYVTSIMTKPITGPDGQERVFSQLRITAKGVSRLSQILAQGVAA
jgi:phage regulator Rha-like protein